MRVFAMVVRKSAELARDSRSCANDSLQMKQVMCFFLQTHASNKWPNALTAALDICQLMVWTDFTSGHDP